MVTTPPFSALAGKSARRILGVRSPKNAIFGGGLSTFCNVSFVRRSQHLSFCSVTSRRLSGEAHGASACQGGYYANLSLFLSISNSATETTDFIIAVGINSTKHDMNAAAKVRSEFI